MAARATPNFLCQHCPKDIEMTQTLPGTETFTRDMRNFAPYRIAPPTLRRPDAAETTVIYIVEPFVPQTPPAPAPEAISGTVYPQPPSLESLMKPGREPEYFAPERPRGTTGKRRGPVSAWVRFVRVLGLGVVLGAGIGTLLTLALVTR